MKVGIAKHLNSGSLVEFMQYTEGNYENTLDWYEKDVKDGYKSVYGRDRIISGNGFSYFTQDGKKEIVNNGDYLVRVGLGVFYHADPRDFKSWYEVI